MGAQKKSKFAKAEEGKAEDKKKSTLERIIRYRKT